MVNMSYSLYQTIHVLPIIEEVVNIYSFGEVCFHSLFSNIPIGIGYLRFAILAEFLPVKELRKTDSKPEWFLQAIAVLVLKAKTIFFQVYRL